MPILNKAARELIESGALAHLATINPDGSPQVSVIWVGLDGDQLISAHLNPRQRKLANLRRDPRVSLSLESTVTDPYGMREYLVINGTAELTEGGGPALLGRLAKTYIGPDAVFPPMPDPPEGFICHITVTSISGNGPWTD
jgi:PPOX class probable F420-dependent enzyme